MRQSASVLSPIGELGRRIESTWRRHDHRVEAFPQLAAAALAEAELQRNLDCLALARCLLLGTELPSQRRSDFGQPPILLWSCEHFFIETLVWIDATTSIHQHAFAGAFTLIEGRSLHARWAARRSEPRELGAGLWLSEIDARGHELLDPGDVRVIEPGAASIHAVFHLVEPSVSLVVRTWPLPEHEPQLRYLPPGLAHDPQATTQTSVARLQMLAALARCDPARGDELLRAFVREASFGQAFPALIEDFERRGDVERLRELLRLTGAEPLLVDIAEAAIVEEQRQKILIARRDELRDPDARLVLGFVVNVHERDELLAAMAAAFKISPAAAARRLSQVIAALAEPLPGARVRLLDVEFAVPEPSPALITELVYAALGERPGPDAVASERVAEIVALLRSSTILKPMLSRSRSGGS